MMKSKVLDNVSKDVPDLDIGDDMNKMSRKGKKKKDRSQKDVKNKGDDHEREEQVKKRKTGDKRGPYGDLKASAEKVNMEHVDHHNKDGVTRADAGVDEIGLVKEGDEHAREERHKKKRNRTELKSKKNLSDNVGDAGSVENHVHYDVTETDQLVKNKKQKIAIMENIGEDDKLGDDSGNEYMKKKKKKRDVNVGTSKTEHINGGNSEVDKENMRKKKKKKKKKDASVCGSRDEDSGNTAHVSVSDNEERNDKGSKKRKEKYRRINNDDAYVDMLGSDKRDTAEPSENVNSGKKTKKVKFSENVEVFPLNDSSSKGKKKQLKDGDKGKSKVDDGLIRGKRFSKEEDDIVKDAVLKYIEDHQLGENGVEMVMKCQSHPEIRNCWKEIGLALPHRPYLAVYYRAHVLFERSESRTWTPEEIELVKKFYKKYGPDWRKLGDELGKHRFHVKDLWRRIRLPNLKKGHWSQEEYQELFNLVNMDLSMKVFSEKKTKHGMLRDNISWGAISDKLSTRLHVGSCLKWYGQLVSPMVAEGSWANSDDYRLLIALSELDASCEEDVDWDNLLEHRSGEICRKRWNQMVRHIGEYGTKSFSEQVDVLSQRYCPDILEARESYDNKEPVD